MHSLLLQVLRGEWYIDPSWAHGAGLLIDSLIQGKAPLSSNPQKFQPVIESLATADGNVSYEEKNVALITVYGALTKEDQECGPAGMDTIGQWIKSFDANPSIASIILKFNTPGGTVSGTAVLGETIKSCSKPIVAFIDDMACSAGYWLASQCDLIVASTPRARVGSIGVMMSFADVQPMWEKEGVKFHEIYSRHSSDKNKDYREMRQGKYHNYQTDVLDPLALDFIAAVTSTRNITDDSILKGRVEFAVNAIKIGLVDQIASIEETIQLAFDLSQANPNNLNIETLLITTKIDAMEKFPRIAAATGVESFESTDEGIHLQVDALEAIEEAIGTAIAKADAQTLVNQQLTEQLETAQQSVTDRDTKIAELTQQAVDSAAAHNARVTELEQEIASVRAAAGASPQVVVSTTDPDTNSDKDELAKFCEENENDPVACMEMFAKQRPDLKLKSF